MPFKFAALDDVIVASGNQQSNKQISEGSQLLLSIADMQSKQAAPIGNAKTPKRMNTTLQHTTSREGISHVRPRYGAPIVTSLSTTIDSSKGDSAAHFSGPYIGKTADCDYHSHNLARSLDRSEAMRNDMFAMINNVDINKQMPQTVSRSFGHSAKQRVPSSLRSGLMGVSSSFQTSLNELQIPQSGVVREHIRSGHVSSNAASGTAAAMNMLPKKQAVKVSLQLPNVQTMSTGSSGLGIVRSPRYLTKPNFPGAVLDRAMRSRLSNQPTAQRYLPTEQEPRKLKSSKTQIASPRKGIVIMKHTPEVTTTKESTAQILLAIENPEDIQSNTDTSAIYPVALCLKDACAEIYSQQPDTESTTAYDIPDKKSHSPPMKLDELDAPIEQATPIEGSSASEESCCMSPAFKIVSRSNQPLLNSRHSPNSGILELNKSSTALKMSSVIDLSPCKRSTKGSPIRKQLQNKSKKSVRETVSSAKSSTASIKANTGQEHQPNNSKIVASSMLSNDKSITLSESDFVKQKVVPRNTISTVSAIGVDSHRNATNPSSLRSIYCNPSSLALPIIDPTPEIDDASIVTCVTQTPTCAKELLRHKYGPDGVLSKHTHISVDPVTDLDASIVSKLSSMAPIIDLPAPINASIGADMEVCQPHSLSDSYLAIKNHTANIASIDWPGQTRNTISQFNTSFRSTIDEEISRVPTCPSAVNFNGTTNHKLWNFNMRPTPMRPRPPNTTSEQIAWTEGSDHTITSFLSADTSILQSARNIAYLMQGASDPETCAVTIYTTTLSSIFSSPTRIIPRTGVRPYQSRFSFNGAEAAATVFPGKRSASAPCLLSQCNLNHTSSKDPLTPSRKEDKERISIFYGTGGFEPINEEELERIRLQKPRSVAGSRTHIEKCIHKLQGSEQQDKSEENQRQKTFSFSCHKDTDPTWSIDIDSGRPSTAHSN